MKIFKYALILMASITVHAQETTEEKWTSNRPDGHAPISVMADHTHNKGDWMFSYRFMTMNMNSLKQGSDDITSQTVFDEGYSISPENMTMNMHMLGLMYAPSNKITLMAMTNYTSMSMDLVTGTGVNFSTESFGFGDLKISALYKFFNKKRQSLHGQLGLSIPTGSINEMDVTPASTPDEVQLPYPMQIGSGTFDIDLGLTYLKQHNTIGLGSQLKATLRTGENDRSYTFGNKYSLNNWMSYKTTEWLSFSARVEGLYVDEISGADEDLTPMMVTTADTENSGGTYINSGIGFNTYIRNGAFKNLRFGFEYSFPLYQNLNGIQLETSNSLNFGAQYSL